MNYLLQAVSKVSKPIVPKRCKKNNDRFIEEDWNDWKENTPNGFKKTFYSVFTSLNLWQDEPGVCLKINLTDVRRTPPINCLNKTSEDYSRNTVKATDMTQQVNHSDHNVCF